MRPIVWFAMAVMVMIFAGIWEGWLAPEPGKPQTKPLPKRVAVQKQDGVVTVPADFSGREISQEELREFSSFFGDAKVPVNFKTEFQVAPGEAIVADVYEAKSGEYVFTKLTPRLKTRDDGSAVVAVEIDCFSVSLNGEVRKIFDKGFGEEKEMAPGSAYTQGQFTDDGFYTVNLWGAEISGDGRSIHLGASGEYHKKLSQASSEESR